MNKEIKYNYENDPKLIVDGLDDASKSILSVFYETYAIGSRKTVCNAIRRICETTNKYTFSELSFEDYTRLQKTSSNKSIINNFFLYLFSFDLLSNPSGFENCYWNKNISILNFDKKIQKHRNDRKNQPMDTYKPQLTLNDLERLLAFLKNAKDSIVADMKLAFCFYALFYLNMDVEELRHFSITQYDEGMIITDKDEYIIDERFSVFFDQLNEKDFTFKQVNEYVAKLGKCVGIENLTPKIIKLAHKQYTFMCPQCGEYFTSFSEYWSLINGKIICNECVNSMKAQNPLKKNSVNTKWNSFEIELISDDEKESISTLLSNFDDVKSKILHPKNYDDINHFLKSIGDLGERYVLEYEQKRLLSEKSRFWELVDGSYALDHNNGFDILSYTAQGKKVYIEVKTTTGGADESFYMSNNEWEFAQSVVEKGEIYRLYRLGNILTDNITMEIYDNLDAFKKENIVYKITIARK